LPEQLFGAIVTPLILRAGRNSPPAVNQQQLKARERFRFYDWKVSRSGVIPGPTVKVRMGESNDSVELRLASRYVYALLKHALILVTTILIRLIYHESDATF
jgi:hypothetical protein